MPYLSRRLTAAAGIVALALAVPELARSADVGDTFDDPVAAVVQQAVPAARSVVLVNTDGMGPAQRSFLQYVLHGESTTQPLDTLPSNGSLRTHSADHAFVTDSAAGATAWATGRKTRNGRVGVDASGRTLQTVLEQARAAGKTTALVEDHDVTDATPAAFAAHQTDRHAKYKIARDYVYRTRPDIMLGGGQSAWYPKGRRGPVPGEEKSIGKQNLVEVARSQGYQYAYDRASFAKLSGPRVLALLRDAALVRARTVKGYKKAKDPYYVPQHLLVQKALDLASQNPKGFFMVVDVDQGDNAGHGHDGRLLRAVGKELDRIVTVLKAFQAMHPETLVIITADHETGGMTIEEAGRARSAASGPFRVKGTDRWISLDWTTSKHTGVAVPVSAVGPNAAMLEGIHDNTYVYTVMHKTLFGP